jgi:hypothetical protein
MKNLVDLESLTKEINKRVSLLKQVRGDHAEGSIDAYEGLLGYLNEMDKTEVIEIADLKNLKMPTTIIPEDYPHFKYDPELDRAASDFFCSGKAYCPFDSTGLAIYKRMAAFGADWQRKKDEEIRQRHIDEINREFEERQRLRGNYPPGHYGMEEMM